MKYGHCCGDCNCYEGQLHGYFPECDQERCPICSGQLLSCKCNKDKITDDMREPFFGSVFSCERCGKVNPELKMIPKEDWQKICGVTYSERCILCEDCINFIKKTREEFK